MEPDRKTLIADTAIRLLGEAGAKGLTHRAVDAAAGLPLGSTSFYCRTRLELLSLALLRHAALDLADIESDGRRFVRSPMSADDVVDLLAARAADWLSPAKRLRLVARFELFLAASHEPELAAVVHQQRERFLQATVAALKQAGVADAATVAPALLATMDGLLLDQVRTRRALLPKEAQRRLFRAVLEMATAEG